MIQVAFCNKGDVFVWRDHKPYWSPMGANFGEVDRRFALRREFADMDEAMNFIKRDLNWHESAAVYIRQLAWVKHRMEHPQADESGIHYIPIDARRELAQ